MSQQLSELIELIMGHRVFIQTHNFPDQDAIASAFGLQVLLENYGIKTIICHHGCVERTATANMVVQFGIEMTTDDDLKDMREEDYIINVDSQKGNSNIRDLIGDEVACIDHHPVFCEAESYRYKDIRIVGSCATIIADYYRQNGIEMPENVATALLYGLKCDTKDFTRGVTELDVEIFNYLFPRADSRLIRRFQSAAIQFDELNAFADSMRNIDIYNGVAFTYLDFTCADAFMATVSDFILDIDKVIFAVVYTRRGNGFKFSVRSEFDELDAGQIVSEALCGIGGGGGHKSMAGGYADEGGILNLGTDAHSVIRKLFLDVITKIPLSEIAAETIPELSGNELHSDRKK
ncbi:MAG: DHH family phosphoesterase [Oscillospiraceae bacterium]|nr:DHH family phosphoesterase [Oscillospiraceae bacterium]